MTTGREPLVVNGQTIPSGSRATLELPVPLLYTHTPVTMPVHIVRGKRDGPHLFVCAALHGDELNGVEIVRRLLASPGLRRMRGTLFAIPIVNVYGVLHHSRYLPDRRDLNRSFPGSERGSLAARLAHLFMREIVAKCTHGIDLHTGANHRSNLPQIRANLDDPNTLSLARSFGAPVLINAVLRDGSLRAATADLGIPMLLYEAGEALRFDEISIRLGLRGIRSVMRELGMLPAKGRATASPPEPFVVRSTSWVRAPQSGISRSLVRLGSAVSEGQLLGSIADPFGDGVSDICAPAGGIVIGRTNLPLVHEGDALFHLARFNDLEAAEARAEELQAIDGWSEDIEDA